MWDDSISDSGVPKWDKPALLRIIGRIGLGILAILLLVGCYTAVRPHPLPLTVTDFSWERSIVVQAWRTVREEDWSIPSGGRFVDSWRAIRYYHHWTEQQCHGSGDDRKCITVSHSDPVYDTKYAYDIERWVYHHTERTAGTDRAPYSPTMQLASDERALPETAIYRLHLKDERGKSHIVALIYNEWMSYEMGDAVMGSANIFGVRLPSKFGKKNE